MAQSFTCDGCGSPVVDPEHVGHVLKRDYCETCAYIAREFLEAEEKLRVEIQTAFIQDRADLIARQSLKLLPDVPA